MKLSNQKIERIAKLYNLGRVKKFYLIRGGAVNYNYIIKTDSGVFIARVLGRKLDDWKKRKLNLEFKTLKFLRENNFPYEIPKPIKTTNKRILSNISGHSLWVYRKLDGRVVKRISLTQMKEIAKAIAIYHKSVSKIQIDKKKLDDSWVINHLKEMRKVKAKNKTDKFMLKNIDFILNCLKRVKCYEFDEKILITHSDFNRSNLLFNKDKLTGIIDFDNIEIAPRIKDIAYAVRRFCFIGGKFNKQQEKRFINEYEKTSKLSKKEKDMILHFMLRDCCIIFWWFYAEMKKMQNKRYQCLKETVNMAKKLEKKLR